MADRAGPPTPRDEPWRMPTPPLPEQPGRTPVPVRDAAFEAWATRGISFQNEAERAFTKAVLCAGWAASKRARCRIPDDERRGPCAYPRCTCKPASED